MRKYQIQTNNCAKHCKRVLEQRINDRISSSHNYYLKNLHIEPKVFQGQVARQSNKRSTQQEADWIKINNTDTTKVRTDTLS